MFNVAAVALVLLILGLSATRGPRVGLWAGWSLALIVPHWVLITVPMLQLEFVTIAGLTAVACFLTTPFSQTIRRWLLCDTLIMVLIALQLATLVYRGSLRPSSLTYSFGEWLLPYMVGRLAIAQREDLDRMTKWLAIPIVLITLYAAIECFAHINLIDSYLGRVWVDQRRYGLSRAYGSTTHPIYFGMFMVLLMPWAIWGAYLARRGSAPRWFVALPVICSCGVFASLSRGPTLALVGTLASVAFFHFHRQRTTIMAGFVMLVLMITVGNDLVIDSLRSLEQQKEDSQQKMIVVDGQEVEYDGTLHRLLLFKVYDQAMWDGGLLGYGPREGETYLSLVDGQVSSVMESIDNHYIIYTLKYGFLGIGTFIVIAICGFYYTQQASLDFTRPTHIFTAAQFGSLVMVTLFMFTVWLAPDFRCMWLFSLGCAAGWRAHRLNDSQDLRETRVAPVRQTPNRRLVPGHPPATNTSAG